MPIPDAPDLGNERVPSFGRGVSCLDSGSGSTWSRILTLCWVHAALGSRPGLPRMPSRSSSPLSLPSGSRELIACILSSFVQVRKKNSLKDCVAVAGPLGVTHFLILSRTDTNIYFVSVTPLLSTPSPNTGFSPVLMMNPTASEPL